MSERISRRAVLATVLVGGVVGLTATDARTLLDRFAPLSGDAWRAADRRLSERVESPYGPAAVRRDDDGVPHVESDDEAAAYFAVGYVHGFDRLFQLDVQRRQMRGELSELAGSATLESDEFHVRMDFVGAAEATWAGLEDTDHAPLVEAYADGVTAAMENERLPLEFELLGYEPDPWTPTDAMLMAKQIAWNLTGDFGELRRAKIADELGDDVVEELFPPFLDHGSPILREGDDALGEVGGASGDGDDTDGDSVDGDNGTGGGNGTDGDSAGSEAVRDGESPADDLRDGAALADWLSRFESPTGVGSNSWVVSGEYTESGRPLVANDPHLLLMTPPVWYEQHVVTPEANVRGFTFPGVPFVVIGANERGAWGFTNVGADVLDCYEYEVDETGDRYRYRGEWREFDREEREIDVAGAESETVAVTKSVHGPVIEREGRRVGVAWTGLTATRTSEAIYDICRSEGLDDVLDALERFDEPTQNFVYADADGRTLYYATGRIPIRTVDGEVVDGDRIFDGSTGEGEWEGFTPYGTSSWDGFVPFEEKPHAIDPDALATANQRLADEPDHYIGTRFASPYRGARIYEVLDEVVEGGDPTDFAFHEALQTDVRDRRAERVVPDLVTAVDAHGDDDERLVDAAETLDEWAYEMERDSRAALLFARWFDRFVEAICEPAFEDAGLDESYYPNDWVVATLSGDSAFFADRSREETMIAALEDTLDELDEEGWETHGDYNTTAPIEHPFGAEAPFLNLSARPADGSRTTVNNYRVESAVGASIRFLAVPGDENRAILPGGNSGDYFSPHYGDQFQRWVDGEYRSIPLEVDGDVIVEFREGSE